MNKSANSGSNIDNRRSLSKPASAGSSGVAASKPAASTNTKSVVANTSTQVERNPRSPKKGNQKLRSDWVSKEANDPVALQNNFGALEDMDFAPSPSSTRVRSHSPKKKTKREDSIKHTKQA